MNAHSWAPPQLQIPFLSFDPARPMQKFTNPGALNLAGECPSPLPSCVGQPGRGWQEAPAQVEPPWSPMPCGSLAHPQSPGHRYGHHRAAPSDVSPRPEAALSPMPCSSFARAQSPVKQRWGGGSAGYLSPGRHQAGYLSPGSQQAFRPSSFAEFGMLGRTAQLPSGRQSFGTPLHHTQPLHGAEPLHHTQPVHAPGGAELLHHTQTYAWKNVEPSPSIRRLWIVVSGGMLHHPIWRI